MTELLNYEVVDMQVIINPETGSVAIMTSAGKDDIVIPGDGFLMIALAHPTVKALVEAAKKLDWALLLQRGLTSVKVRLAHKDLHAALAPFKAKEE